MKSECWKLEQFNPEPLVNENDPKKVKDWNQSMNKNFILQEKKDCKLISQFYLDMDLHTFVSIFLRRSVSRKNERFGEWRTYSFDKQNCWIEDRLNNESPLLIINRGFCDSEKFIGIQSALQYKPQITYFPPFFHFCCNLNVGSM